MHQAVILLLLVGKNLDWVGNTHLSIDVRAALNALQRSGPSLSGTQQKLSKTGYFDLFDRTHYSNTTSTRLVRTWLILVWVGTCYWATMKTIQLVGRLNCFNWSTENWRLFVICPKKLATWILLEHRINLNVIDISVAHLVKRHWRLLDFFLNGHAHVWVDSGASGCVAVLAEIFVRGLNVVEGYLWLSYYVLLGFGCQSFEPNLSARLNLCERFLLFRCDWVFVATRVSLSKARHTFSYFWCFSGRGVPVAQVGV